MMNNFLFDDFCQVPNSAKLVAVRFIAPVKSFKKPHKLCW